MNNKYAHRFWDSKKIYNKLFLFAKRSNRAINICKNSLPILYLLLLGLFTHGILLINDGIYWESWTYQSHIATLGENPNLLHTLLIESRILSHVIYDKIISYIFVNNINFGFKLIGFVNITLSAIFVYMLTGHLIKIDKSLRLWLSSFLITVPTQALAVDYGFVRYLTDLTIFYFATLCAIHANKKNYSPIINLFIRLSAFGSYWLSFHTGSLLVFYLIAFCYIIFIQAQSLASIALLQSFQSIKHIAKIIIRNLDFLLLPILFWFANRWVYPITAQWVYDMSYNQINLSGLLRPNVWLDYFYTGTIALIKNGLQLSLDPPFFLLLIIIYGFRQAQNKSFISSLKWATKILLFGFITLILATLPYIAVGRVLIPNNIFSYFMRYFLLYPLPIAIGCIAFSRLLSKYTLSIVLLAFIYTNIDFYFAYQARFVKDLSVKQNILEENKLNRFSIIRVIDQYPIDNRFPAYFGQDALFEKTAYFRWLLNGDKFPIALSFVDGQILDPENIIVLWVKSSPIVKEYINYHQLNTLGCYGQLVISKTDYAQTLTTAGTSLRYWYYRFLRPDQLNTWVSTLSFIQLKKIEMPEATACL